MSALFALGFSVAYVAPRLGVPFVLSAIFMRELPGKLKPLHRSGRALQLVAGPLLVLMGSAMITGQVTAFGFWLLKIFPGIQTNR